MKPSPQQRDLPLTRDARFAALDAIDPRAVGVGPRAWRGVVELCKQIELCGQRDGCYAYVATLAERMKVCKRTVQRYAEAGEAAGVLARDARRNLGGQQSNAWSVDWTWVVGHAEAKARASARDEALASGPGEDRRNVKTVTPPRQTVTLIRGSVPSTISSSVSGRQEATGEILSEGAAAAVAAAWRIIRRGPLAPPPESLARKFCREVGPVRKREDASLGWKLVAIGLAGLGEQWLWDLPQAARQCEPGNPWAYVQRCAYRGTHRFPGPGVKPLKRLLAMTPEPPPGWPRVPVGPDLSQRLCAVGEDEL